MTRLNLNCYFALAFLLLPFGITGCSQRSARYLPDGPALADFDHRVKEYAAMRGEMMKGTAQPKEAKEPEKIEEAEKALAAKIQGARKSARRGDIFTPAIEERFRVLLNPELKGERGRNTRGIIFDEGPGEFAFKVNGAYPKDKPLGSVPPNLLEALPPLPEGIEYRFVDKHLILRDTRANLIIDDIPVAIA